VLGAAAVFRSSQTAGRPAVVNISLNGTEGPHDGETPYEAILRWLCLSPGRAIVVGAGNFYEKRYHARGVVSSSAPIGLTWRFLAKDTNSSEIEIWYDVPASGDMLKIVLNTPWGEKIEVDPGVSKLILRNGMKVGEVTNFDHDPLLMQGTRRLIYLWAEPHERRWKPPTDEDWHVDLEIAGAVAPDVEINFNAWISRDDYSETAFADGSSVAEQTLGTLACNDGAIVVGAYSVVAERRASCPFSSAGPTRDDRQVPDIAAPGRGVWAARSTGFRMRYPGSTWRKSAAFVMDGTSTATPFVAGTVALMLQKNPRLLSYQIKYILKASARPQVAVPLAAANWDHQLGVGFLSTANAVANTP
jgi:hypothetical protein